MSGAARRRRRESVAVEDSVEVYVRRGGKLVKVSGSGDLITNVGISRMMGLVVGVYDAPFRYVAVGTGTTPPSRSDTALENEVARALASVSLSTRLVQNDTAVLQATFSFGEQVVISESGVFDGPSGGSMLCRAVFYPVEVVPGEELPVVWRVTLRRW